MVTALIAALALLAFNAIGRLLGALVILPVLRNRPKWALPYAISLFLAPLARLLEAAGRELTGVPAAILLALARVCWVPGVLSISVLVVIMVCVTPGYILVAIVLSSAVARHAPFALGAAVLCGWMLYVEGFTLVRALAARTGWWQAALLLGTCCTEMSPTSREAPGIVAACIALRRRPDPSALDRLTFFVSYDLQQLGPQLLVRGMMAAARGDDETCRRWLLTIPELTVTHARLEVRQTAAAWLCAWAAGRGRWREVRDFAVSVGETPELRFWEACARRMLDADSVSDAELRRSWRGCPRETRPLLDRALKAAPQPPALQHADVAHLTGLARAQALHLVLMRTPPHQLTSDDVAQVGAAWDEALMRPDVPPGVRREVVQDLVDLMRAGRVRLPASPASDSIVESVRIHLTDAVMREMTQLAKPMMARLNEGRTLPAYDEWLEYVTLRLVYEDGLAMVGQELATAMWPTVHRALNLIGVKLRKPMDHQIFRWLVQEAELRDDPESLELEQRNVRVTRRGEPEPSWYHRNWFGGWTLHTLLLAISEGRNRPAAD